MRAFLAVLLLALLSGCAPYRVTHDLAYGPHERQVYDFYEPLVGKSERPTLLVIHGGGYVSGDKEWADSVAEMYCPLGYAVVAMNYHLTSQPGGEWPVQLQDAKDMLAHMRTDAGMNYREPIAGLGVSAGAHLIGMLHLQGDLPLAIGIAGPWDLEDIPSPNLDDTVRALLGLPAGSPIPPGARNTLSPVFFVRPEADMLLIHARRDPVVPYAHAESMVRALKAVGADVELVTIDSSSHGSVWKDAFLKTLVWLRARQQ